LGSKSKVSKIAPIFGRYFFLLRKGRAFQKLHPHYHPCLAARRLEKFPEDTPTSPEVIGGAYASKSCTVPTFHPCLWKSFVRILPLIDSSIVKGNLFCSHFHRSDELIWLWPFWSVAVLDFQCGRFGRTSGRFGCGRFGLWPFWTTLNHTMH